MNQLSPVDLYFVDARSKLLDVAAFLDRVERAGKDDDYRVAALRAALKQLDQPGAARARNMLLSFSDPTTEPIARAATPSATGAWSGAR